MKIEAQTGDIDLRGFQVVRGELFNTPAKPRAIFSSKDVGFNSGCVKKINGADYVEMLFHPERRLLAVRPCFEDFSNAVRWADKTEEGCHPRRVNGKAWLNTLYGMCGWDIAFKYRAHGVFKEQNNEPVLIFNMREAEMFRTCIHKRFSRVWMCEILMMASAEAVVIS